MGAAASGPWLNRRVLVALVVAAAVIGAIVVSVAREGPDVSTVGRVSVVEAHRLCVTDAGGVDPVHVLLARGTDEQTEVPLVVAAVFDRLSGFSDGVDAVFS